MMIFYKVVKLFTVITFFCDVVYSQNIYCRERERLVSTKSADLFELVDATLGSNITLKCTFCDEVDDGQAKNWFKSDRLGTKAKELTPGMENDREFNRIVVNNDHSLSIFNVSMPDRGVYYCRNLEMKEINMGTNYYIDIIDTFSGEPETGNLSDWKTYYEEFMSPLNKLLLESEGYDFVHARQDLKLSMELYTYWEPFSKCLCDQPGGKRQKKKRGLCRIKLRRNGTYDNTDDADVSYVLKGHEISCRSRRLEQIFPDISNRTRVIPDFVQVEMCVETCTLDDNGENRGWKVGKTKGFKYRKTFVLMEKSHLTLVCPESTLDNSVVWRKRGKSLKPGDASYSHMYVDSFNILYLVNVTNEEEGNYTCQVDDIQMQRINIFIVKKSKFLSGELTRHMGYLGCILLLTVPCYFAGLTVTWWRRRTFESYEDYMKEKGKIPYEEDDEMETLL
uniref:Uncharacterized protein LOC114334086 isoform X1 n=1 Tax=Diabrotica virgifera virgifera TaxID=50390 RepID=A0A6P7FYK3_DIAVI